MLEFYLPEQKHHYLHIVYDQSKDKMRYVKDKDIHKEQSDIVFTLSPYIMGFFQAKVGSKINKLKAGILRCLRDDYKNGKIKLPVIDLSLFQFLEQEYNIIL